MNRKGITISGMELVGVMIILLVTIVFLSGALSQILELFKIKSETEACRASLLAHATLKKAPLAIPSKIDCPRKKMVFYDDKVMINDKKVEEFSKLTNDIVNRHVAEQMRNCWYAVGEGKLDVFSGEIAGINNVCLVCAEITFGEDVDDEIYGYLDKYVKENKVPVKGKEEITYADYLGPAAKIYGSVDTAKKYYIFFMAMKPDLGLPAVKTILYPIFVASNLLTPGQSELFTTPLSDEEMRMLQKGFVTVGSIDVLSDGCTYLYN